jgi:rSAM/selenodomain-associated transferase 1
LYVAGDAAHPQLVRIAKDHGFELRAQAGADLGARMAAAIADELADGASAVVLVGTDSPTLPGAYLQRAAAWLGDDAEVVLGPAADGGYYLVGARRPLPQLFAAGISWGTPQVLPATLLRLRELAAAGTRVALLPFFYDVDTPQDLWLLACHLRLAAATVRAAAKAPEAAQRSQAEQGSKGSSGSAGPVADAPAADAAPAAGVLSAAAGLAAMDALTGLHAPATCAALAALGWLEPTGPASDSAGR